MKKKQLISIIITGIVIIAVGVTGTVSNVLANKIMSSNKTAVSSVSSFFQSDNTSSVSLPDSEFIGVINIVGEIGQSSSDVFSDSGTYNHSLYMNYIEKMEKSKKNKGILLYVDSPGGAVYESDELYLRLMEYKKKTKRPIWAYFASQACSGGYYISMAADKIYANRNTWTGSIGVIVSLVNCKELYDKLGIKEIDIASGKNKAMGSAALDLTEEQRQILQSLVDEAYDQFVGIVADGRKMKEDEVRKLADGRIYSAKQAKDNGLVDEISSYEEVKKAFRKELNVSKKTKFYIPDSGMGSWFDTLLGKIDNVIPESETDLASDIMENRGNGVLKYYAK